VRVAENHAYDYSCLFDQKCCTAKSMQNEIGPKARIWETRKATNLDRISNF